MTRLEQIQELISKVPKERLDELKTVIERFLKANQRDRLTEEEHRTLMRHIEEVAALVPPGEEEQTSLEHDRILYSRGAHP
jgi:endonuclease III